MVIDIKIPKTKKDYSDLNARLEALWDRAEKGTQEGEEFELLILLKKEYERKHQVLPKSDPIDLIKLKMDQLDLSPIDLVPMIGHKSTVSRVLSGERPLTISMIKNLSKHLDIPLELLIQLD